MKLLECLPCNISDELCGIADLRELRIRNGGAVKLNVGGQWYYLGIRALLTTPRKAITASRDACDEIVKRACSNSVYAYEKTLASGYFTLEDGVRVGVCGSVFGTNTHVFQQYTSLCFRVPHYVNCVSAEMLEKCRDNNVLVMGAPATGKTTFLRDLAVKLGQLCNVLVVDERGELFYDDELLASSECDVLKWGEKAYAFEVGIRAMSPQYIVCDELTEADIPFVQSCLNSGVRLICSVHTGDESDFERKFGLRDRFGVLVNLNKKEQ